MAHIVLQNVDALLQGEGGSLSSTVILNYIDGITTYKAWHSNCVNNLMDDYHKTHHTKIPPIPSAPPDDMDTDYNPPREWKCHTPTRSGLEEMMDKLNMFLMYIHGIIPEMAAECRQKEIEWKEWAAQEVSQSKVMEWRNHLDV